LLTSLVTGFQKKTWRHFFNQTNHVFDRARIFLVNHCLDSFTKFVKQILWLNQIVLRFNLLRLGKSLLSLVLIQSNILLQWHTLHQLLRLSVDISALRIFSHTLQAENIGLIKVDTLSLVILLAASRRLTLLEVGVHGLTLIEVHLDKLLKGLRGYG
jgi:hypothetical protein